MRLERTWRDLHALFSTYSATDPESAWIRARQLEAVVRLTPYLMGANIVNALAVGVVVLPTGPVTYLAWALALGCLITLALRAWMATRDRPPVMASRRALGRSTLHAAALGVLWGAVPLLWFQPADPARRIIIAMLTAGMMAAGAFALSPLPAASLAYVAALAIASLASLPTGVEALSGLMVPLICVYAAVCVLGSFSAGRTLLALLRSQREADRQRHIVTVLLHDFQENVAEALWETTVDGKVTHASARLAELLRAEPQAMLGQPLAALLDLRRKGNGDQILGVFERRMPFRNLLLPASGATEPEQWWHLSGKPIRDSAQEILAWRGVLADATAETVAARRLKQLAHYDSVTGLANRVTLREALRERLAQPGAAALLTVDLDRFKAINDTFGHSTGDAVLTAVGRRLRQHVRPGDLVARLGGDEFAVLMRSVREPIEAVAMGRRLVDAFSVPTEAAGRQLLVGVSAGVAVLPEHGEGVDEILGNADLALYDAKVAGRGRVAMYARHLGASHRRRAAVEQALKHVLDEGQLSLVWQPQVDVRESRIVGAEALLRWHHPTLGTLGPDEFIAVAEQTGTMGRVGEWVLREACRTAATGAWATAVAVNVSTVQLRDSSFVDTVEGALASSGLDPRRLEIELTESIFLDDVDAVLGRLRELQAIGVRIVLDDFGTGYSSLGYLCRFPFDTLKIDRAFVRELCVRPDVHAIVGTIIQLGNKLRMRTVAEGVETDEQRQQLANLGCYHIQGYLVSKPVGLHEIAVGPSA